MRQNVNQTTMYVSDYDSQIMPINENTTYQGGSSQVFEPEIINIIDNQGNTKPVKSTVNLEDIENNLPKSTTSPIVSSLKDTEERKPQGEPSATTDQTKTYVGGGTTPDSQIVVKKPTTKYFVYGILGIVGAYVVYRLFFNKKSE